MNEISPGLILILGALLVPVLRGPLRAAYLLALPAAALMQLLALPMGEFGQVSLFGMELVTLRIDPLSLIFGYVFLIGAWLGVVYSLHVKDTVQHVAGLVYAGSAVGAVFAGDLVTLFVYWEGTAVASVFLIWASRTDAAYRAGMRYLLVQIGSGVLLLAGVMMRVHESGDIAFGAIEPGTLSAGLILLAFGIKCAFPLLHSWMPDAYPRATVTGTVILSMFTTKLAVYALARGFAGTEILVPIGAVMAIFPVFYALAENDLRRVLAYSLNSQLGFMVVGVGIGTELALNGAAAHAASSVIYKALLFMSVGAAMHRLGTANASDLGGLYRSMPWTTAFCLVGAASISAVPLFIGFASKALILAAAMKEDYFWTWLILLFASVGAVLHSGLKVPYFTFFATGPGRDVREAPANMLVAMAAAAALCIALGALPGLLYGALPFPVDYRAYTTDHVVTQLQLVSFAALAFFAAMRLRLLPTPLPSAILDVDWFCRVAARTFALALWAGASSSRQRIVDVLMRRLSAFIGQLYRHHGPQGIMARSWPTGSMAFWTTFLLVAYLFVYYI